jgi:hypothetical protein
MPVETVENTLQRLGLAWPRHFEREDSMLLGFLRDPPVNPIVQKKGGSLSAHKSPPKENVWNHQRLCLRWYCHCGFGGPMGQKRVRIDNKNSSLLG